MTDQTAPQPKPLRRRIGLVLAVLALQGLATFALLEVVGRLADPMGVSYYPNTAAYMDTLVIEEPIGYRNQPNLNGSFFDHQVTINSIGLRHREIELAPDPSKYRIALLGDSVIFGVGVSDNETLAVHLESILREQVGLIDGREVEVINMGCISYNAEQELIGYQERGAQLAPDLVLLMFSENDIEPKMWIFSKRSNPLVRIGQRSYAVSLLLLLKRELMSLLPGAQPLIQSSSYRKSHPRWGSISSSYTEINRLAAAADAPFVVLMRSKTQVSWTLLTELSEREGFELMSVRPYDDDRWKHLDPRDFRAKGGGNHANGEALRMYATLIYEQTQAMGILGSKRSAIGQR